DIRMLRHWTEIGLNSTLKGRPRVFLLLLMSGVAAVLWWLVSPRLGTPCHWADAPGGELSFRLRFGSPLAALLWFGRRGDCGLALLGVVHIREQTVTRSLLAHELGHLV